MLKRAVIAFLMVLGITAGISVAPAQAATPSGAKVVAVTALPADIQPLGLAQCEYVSWGKFCGWDAASSSGNPLVEVEAGLAGVCLEFGADNRISYVYARAKSFRLYANDGCWGTYVVVGNNQAFSLTGLSLNNNGESVLPL